MGAWMGGMWLDAPGNPCPTCDCHVLEAPEGTRCGEHPQCKEATCASAGCGHVKSSHFEASHHCMELGCDCPGFQPKEGGGP